MLVKNIARNLAVIACCLLNEFTRICQTNFLIFFILQDYDTSHPQWEFLQMIRYSFPCSLLLVGVYSIGSLDLKGVLQSFGPETSGGKWISKLHTFVERYSIKMNVAINKGGWSTKKLLQFAIHLRVHCPETKRTTQPSFCLKRMLGINFTHCIVCGFFSR